MNSLSDLLKGYTVAPVSWKSERGELVKEIAQYTGFSEGYIRFRTKGMQTPADLRFVLSSMKTIRNAKDNKHKLNIVLFTPQRG